MVIFFLFLLGSLLAAGGSEPVLYVLGQINNSEEEGNDVTKTKQQPQLATNGNSTDLKLYQKLIPEPQGLVELTYPSNWTLSEIDDFQGFGYLANLYSPFAGENDTFKENVKIYLDSITSFAPYTSSLTEYANGTIEWYKNNSKNFEVIDSDVAYTREFPSYRIVYEIQFEDSEQIQKGVDFGYQVGNDIYALEFLSENPGQYEQYEHIVNHIFSSFRVVQFLPYYDADLGVYLQYPSNFDNSGSSFTFYDYNLNETIGTATLMKAPAEGGNESLLDEEENLISIMTESHPGFSVIERSDTNSSTILTRRILANDSESGFFSEWLFGISNGNLYSLYFKFPSEYYDYFQIVKTNMMNTFVAFEFYPYVSSNFDLYIEYPSSWKKSENTPVFTSDGETNQVVKFISPIENDKIDEFQENLVISTSYNANDSLDSIIDQQVSMLGRNLSGFEIIEERTPVSIGSLAGNSSSMPAQEIIYRYIEQDGSTDKQVREIWSKDRGSSRLFQIKFVSALDRYDNYAEIANRMIGSLRLYEDPNVASVPSSKLVIFNHSETGISIKHPETWQVQEYNDRANGRFRFDFFSPIVDNVEFQDYINLSIQPSQGYTLRQTINMHIGSLTRQFLQNPQVVDSSPFTLWTKNNDNDTQAHRLIIKYEWKNDPEKKPLYSIIIIAKKNDTIYALSYYADIYGPKDHFLEFIQAINSFDLEKLSLHSPPRLINGGDLFNSFGTHVDGNVFDLAFDRFSNKLFAVATRAGAVSIINMTTGQAVETVKVEKTPLRIALDKNLDSAYVTNCMSDSLSVISISRNELIDTIDVGKSPWDIVVNPGTQYAYVINHGSRSISVIDTIQNYVTKNIPLPINPIAIAINEYTNRIYVTGDDDKNILNACLRTFDPHGQNQIVVIDGNSHQIIDRIELYKESKLYELGPTAFQPIAVDSITNTIYSGDVITGSLIKIDGYTHEIINIKRNAVNGIAINVEVNPETGKVYISSSSSGDLSVIDGESMLELKNWKTLGVSTSIAIDPYDNIVYFNDYTYSTINEMNGHTNEVMFEINLAISPPGSGKIDCMNKQTGEMKQNISSNIRLIYDNDTEVMCTAHPETDSNLSIGSMAYLMMPFLEDWLEPVKDTDYIFTSWSGTAGEDTRLSKTLPLLYHHDLVANFQEKPPLLPKEYRTTIFGIFLTVVIPLVGRWVYLRRKRNKEIREKTT